MLRLERRAVLLDKACAGAAARVGGAALGGRRGAARRCNAPSALAAQGGRCASPSALPACIVPRGSCASLRRKSGSV